LRVDRTIGEFERIIETGPEEAIYSFEYTEDAKVLSPIVSAANGVILDMKNEGATWLLTVWMADRTDLDHLWDYARRHDIDIDLKRLNEYGRLETADVGVTESQRDALLVAFDKGYFEEPRDAALSEVAAELDISQPAAGGLIRRGTKRLIESCLRREREDG
jgi:predicted DNA binding protein